MIKTEKGRLDIQYEDLDEVQRLKLAKIIAKKNLPKLNQKKEKVSPPNTVYVRYGKRLIDIIISFFALIVSIPINLMLLIITFIDVGQPVIFTQVRTGKDGKTFKLYKFRNMTNKTDERGILLPPDKRVTKWGRFVRKTSMDELLNFVSVFVGNMSLIGPRPMPAEYRERMTQYHDSRHTVRPGLECPLHDKRMGDMTWENRFDNDVWYIQNMSLKTDVKMFWLLVKDALWGTQKEKRATGAVGTFMGYTPDGSIIDSRYIPQEYIELLFESEEGKIEEECLDLSRQWICSRGSLQMPSGQSAV